MSIARTIVSEINVIDPWALPAWGAKEVVLMNDGLKFKTSGSVGWKGYVYIQYDYGRDLYNIVFARIRKLTWVVEEKIEQVYVKDLVRIINEKVC